MPLLLLAICGGWMSWLPFSKAVGNDDFLERLKKQWAAFWAQMPEDRVYLQLDRPFYYPGDSIHFSAFLRDGINLLASQKSNILHVELLDPKGTVAQKLVLDTDNGRAVGAFALNADIVGGLYVVKAYTQWQLNDPEPAVFEKEVQVQKIVLPNLKMSLDFQKKSYSPGEEVLATFEAQTNENQALKNMEIEFRYSLEGSERQRAKLKTDGEGKSVLRFSLPNTLRSSDGLLNVLLVYQGNTESISRSIPILFNKINLQFYPEGGDLVSGLGNRIAFKATDEHGKAADVSASLFNGRNEKLMDFATYDRGMGAIDFQAVAHESYYVKLNQPTGIDQKYDLPEALLRGYLLRVDRASDRKASIQIRSTENEEIALVAQVRGKICYAQKHRINKGVNPIEINTDDFPMGVCQLTLFDSRGIERAERLFFVNSERKLDVNIRTDKEKYQPGEQVKVRLSVKDDRGMPVPASLSMSVVNDQLLSFADDHSGNIFSSLLLEADIKGKLDDPSYYFDSNEKKSKESLDLLLLTSGWRRFAWKDVESGSRKAPTFEAEFFGASEERDANGWIVSGVVLDRTDGAPLPGCVVKIKGSQNGAITNLEGRYTLKGLKSSDILLFSFMGYIACEKKILDAKKILMARAQVDFDEVVVVGYGAKKNAEREDDVPRHIKMAPNAAMDVRKGGGKEENIVLFDAVVAGGAEEEGKERVREYAQEDEQQVKAGDVGRHHFNPTVYWNGLVEVDRHGEATVCFANNDQISSFSIRVEGIGKEGSLGACEKKYFTQLPFSLSCKLPYQAVCNDLLLIPLTLVNHTDQVLSGKLKIAPPAGFVLQEKLQDSYSVAAQQTSTIWLKYRIANLIGLGKFSASFDAGKYQDAFSQQIDVKAKGFPVDLSFAGQDLEKSFPVEINHRVDGSMTAQLLAYPSVMSDLLKGVEGILREPYGCFEQTSMSSYPNLFVLDYLRTSGSDDKKLLASAEKLLGQGYKKLISFETAEKGYEWFGGAPAHEALTAYGLMQFHDMKSVSQDVDQGMIDRTAKWLMDRRDGEGGFLRNDRALDSYGRASKEITNAYIVYAMAEAGYTDIQKEYQAAKSYALSSKDPYCLALVANAAFSLKKDLEGEQLFELLSKMQQENGCWMGTNGSITCSAGRGLAVETSSLAVMAYLKSKQALPAVLNNGVKFIVSCRSGYGDFGSTQSTVLALKALTQYAKYSKRTSDDGKIEILLDGKQIAEASYLKGESRPIELNGLEKYIVDGKSKLTVRYLGTKNALPYSIGINYFTSIPQSSDDCKLALSCKWDRRQARVGETLRLTTLLSNKSKTEGLPMSMAVIGIPAGLSAQAWQLKELKEKQIVDFYEIQGNAVICYFRQMKPGEVKTIQLDLKAEFPGEFDSPASSAYLYYTNEFKNWQLAGGVVVNK